MVRPVSVLKSIDSFGGWVGELADDFVGAVVVSVIMGAWVGCLDGPLVGSFVGGFVGLVVGVMLGASVGVTVGALVGVDWGDSVGDSVFSVPDSEGSHCLWYWLPLHSSPGQQLDTSLVHAFHRGVQLSKGPPESQRRLHDSHSNLVPPHHVMHSLKF